MNNKLLQRLRKWHKWPSLVFTLFILLFAFSGIILNHRDLLSGIDVNRKLLPPGYRYQNWNLAAIRGGVPWGRDSLLVYGNIGTWLTDASFHSFSDLNAGFPDGIDNRKISSVSIDSVTGVYAGTLFGLFRFDRQTRRWDKTEIPVQEERIVKVLAKGDSLMVMTRSYLLVSTAQNGLHRFRVIRVPESEDDDRRTGLFKTLWVIHSGEIYGLVGKLIVDAVGIIFILLCITGLIYFLVPYRLKQLSDEVRKTRLKHFNRNTLRWHNVAGSWAIPLLILTTLTGMFLRPPLLIPIAEKNVHKIPFTELDSPNPWFDRFRNLLYDKQNHRWMVATSEGIFQADERFSTRLKPFTQQPPVSVMGINVFQKLDSTGILVGSFSGLFRWEPETGRVWDYFTKMPYREKSGAGQPFGALSVAGYIKWAGGSQQLAVDTTTPQHHGTMAPRHHGTMSPRHHGTMSPRHHDTTAPRHYGTMSPRHNGAKEIVFDYAGGALSLSRGEKFPQMPAEMIARSPISLWNAALEIHTGRIFQPILGEFYILVVPLVGLFALEVSVIGFLAWWVARKRKQRFRT